MQLTIKASGGKSFDVTIADDGTVLDLKNEIQRTQPTISASSVRLIYSGKILSDGNTLQSYGITNGHSLHIVVARPQSAAAPPPPASDPPPVEPFPVPPSEPPPPAQPAGGFPDIGALLNTPQAQQMMQQLINNPQMMNDMIRNNPFLQRIAQNPGAMGADGGPRFGGRSLADVMNSPMFHQAIEQLTANPQQLADLLRSNPMFANLPDAREVIANPEMLAQQIRMMQQMAGAGGAGAAPNFGGFGGLAGQAAEAASAFGTGGGTAGVQVYIDQALLARLLGAGVGDAQRRLIASNAEVRRGLATILQGIALCRANGLPLLSDVPNVDTIIASSIANLGAPAAAAGPGFAPPPAAMPAAPAMSPEQRFGAQLAQMNEFGFNDNQRNIEALIATNGNVQLAINYLLGQ
jgi:ubiquilin